MRAPIKNFVRVALSLVVLGSFVGCDNEPDSMSEFDHRWKEARHQIEGAVYFRERIALPGTAELEVELVDISKPDKPIVVSSSGPIRPQGSPPYDFAIDIIPSRINQRLLRRKGYGLRATIHVDRKLMFASEGFMDAMGAEPKQVLVVRVPDTQVKQSAGLEVMHWRLHTLAGKLAPLGAGGRQVDIRFLPKEGRAAGFSGCNRFTGSFTASDTSKSSGTLTFGPIAGTRMACPQGDGDIEQPFLQTLGKVTAYRLQEDTLSFVSENEVLATFKPM